MRAFRNWRGFNPIQVTLDEVDGLTRPPQEFNFVGRHNRYWGHDYNTTHWDKDQRLLKMAVWLTPGPQVGDCFLIEGEQSIMEFEVISAEWTSNVIDMYWVVAKHVNSRIKA